MTVGERIKIIREIFEITSNEFAEITGIHPVTIRKYETNKMKPSKEHIDKMCSTLKLPRIIFEGIPEQYTDYSFRGDFYQQLFLLYANKTITYSDDSFQFNPALGKHIEIKANGKPVAIEDLEFSVKSDKRLFPNDFGWFTYYLKLISEIDNADDSESKSVEHKQNLINFSEEIQLKLMLADHSWRQYMKGMSDLDEFHRLLEEVLSNGGNVYDFVKQIDAPDSFRAKYIKEYEDARIAEYIGMVHFPEELPREKIPEWVDEKIEKIEQYKIDHPNYKEEIRLEEEQKRNKK